MSTLLHQLVERSALRAPAAPALLYKDRIISYATMQHEVETTALGLVRLGLNPDDRVAIYLPKLPETVYALFATVLAGGIFVPVNPVLKADQVGYILRDCNVSLLVTSADRAASLEAALQVCADLRRIIVIDDDTATIPASLRVPCMTWAAVRANGATQVHRRIDADVAAILYTSGSTGKPKGVVLSHRNLTAGAQSVGEYLHNTAEDRLLAVLPFSFDYGLSQLTTAFLVGASVVLMDYLLPRDVLRAIVKHRVTGLAAVPPLWNQLAALPWPDEAKACLRYVTNSGGALPRISLDRLRATLPDTLFYLMYGLTEAFRSTYLDPGEIDRRPDSIGKAIPNAEIRVVREDGSECAAGEPGELVHRGVHVALGYWNNPQKTGERFKPFPGQLKALVSPELTVWSGDQVRRDADGFLYFINRKDEMIKTSGYRVSPTEVEEVVYRHGDIAQAVAVGVPHPMLGQAIVLVVQGATGAPAEDELLEHCRQLLPQYMVPAEIHVRDALPRNPNGKIDRQALAREFQNLYTEG